LDSRLFIAVLDLALLDSLNPMLFAGELYFLRGAVDGERGDYSGAIFRGNCFNE
jgi:hypothetical protein